MKLFLLKILLQRRARDEGFTLPMVIALGLVMLLLGAINLSVSNEENLTAISQNSRSDALAIAEVGIARYRELLDRNRVLAINDHSQWGSLNQVCDDNIDSLLPTVTATTPPVTTLSPQKVIDSQDLDNDGDRDEALGSYSLVSYDYSNADGTLDLTDDALNSDATGRLTVRGTAANDSGEVQITVDIPIRINLDDMKNLAPALWIGDNTVSAADLGNLTIGNGNVVIRDPAVTTTGSEADGCRNFADTDTTDGSQDLASGITFSTPLVTTPPTPQGTVISDSRNLPSIQKIYNPTATTPAEYGDIEKAINFTNTSGATEDLTNDIPAVSGGQILFGQTTHKPYNADDNTKKCPNIKLCRYYYDPPAVAGTTLTYEDEDLLTDGVARTTLLLNQDLTISATSDPLDATVGKDVEVGSTSNVDKDSNAFEIYVNGNRNITINADTGRTVTIHGFIHAPDSTLTITGDGTVNIFGSVWVNDFDNSDGTTVTISPDIVSRVPTPSDRSTSGRAYKFYSTTNSRTAKPITGSPINWKTEQIN